METKKFIVEVDENNQIVGTPIAYDEAAIQAQMQAQATPEPSFLATGMPWVLLIVGVLFLVGMFFATFFIVKQQTMSVIERFGKFLRVVGPGLHFKIPVVDQIAGEVDLRVKELVVEVDTKTSDNVFVKLAISVQFFVSKEKAYDAFYKLQNASKQVSSYVFDQVRSTVPKMTLDEVFEKKDTIATDVKANLTETMTSFGYEIVQTLVTDITPSEKVMHAMNEINTQKRLRVAAEEKGEADKILEIKKAEAESESKILQGKGIAGQRAAIVEGLKTSIAQFKESVPGANEADVMAMVLTTQYFDTLKEIGQGNRVILLPHSPSAVNDIGKQIRDGMVAAGEVVPKEA